MIDQEIDDSIKVGSSPILKELNKDDFIVVKDPKKVAAGKKSKAQGARHELRVRDALEKQGWIVDKWTNNVEFPDGISPQLIESRGYGKLVKAKAKWAGPGRPMMMGAGFPDFSVWHKDLNLEVEKQFRNEKHNCVGTFAVEAKMDGILDKEEKAKCRWLLYNKIFIKILIARKGEKRGEIKYEEFQ